MLIASHSNLRYHCNLKADFEMREASQSEIEMSKQSQTETEKFAVYYNINARYLLRWAQ